MPKNPDEIGALWIKQGSKGEYLSGTIDGTPVVVFKNDRATGNQPQWRVLKSRPKGEREFERAKQPAPPSGGFEDDSDIPF